MHARVAVKPARAKKMSQAMVYVPEKGAKNNWLNPKWMQKQIGEAVGQAMTPHTMVYPVSDPQIHEDSQGPKILRFPLI